MPKKLILADDTPQEFKRTMEEAVWEDHDPAYIPGYSEVIKANEVQHANVDSKEKETYYKRWGTGPRHLPFEFVYLRMTNAAGGPSHSAAIDRMSYQQAGYTICTKDDYLTLMDKYPEILTGTPWEAGSALLEPDGTIRRLDSALFVVMTDNPRYLAWQRRRAEDRERLEENTQQPVGPGGYSLSEERGQFEGSAYER